MNERVKGGLHSILFFSVIGFAILAPVSLFLIPYAGFNNPDWVNHQWQVGYYAEYLRAHGTFPTVLHTRSAIGFVSPLFYGYLFFPICACLSYFVGPALALRAIVFLLWLGQFYFVYQVLRRPSDSSHTQWQALVGAILVGWTVYPLTNLYHRSAFPELFATVSQVGAVCSWVLALRTDEPLKRTAWFLSWGLLLTLSFGAHPISALLGAPCLVLIGISSIGQEFRLKRGTAGWLLAICVCSAITLLPWWYVTHQFVGEIVISSLKLIYYPAYDRFPIRFFPLPKVGASFDELTPYLETQINLPLLIFLAASAYGVIRGRMLSRTSGFSFCVCLVGFIISAAWSIYPVGESLIPEFFMEHYLRYAQHAYRLVSFSNLFLFSALIALSKSEESTSRVNPWVAAFCVALSGLALVTKLDHAYSSMIWEGDFANPLYFQDPRVLTETPKTYYGYTDYMVIPEKIQLTEKERADAQILELPVGHGAEFGIPGQGTIDFGKSGWLVTNVYFFPWNQIQIDGISVPKEKIFSVQWSRDTNYSLLPSLQKHRKQLIGPTLAIPLSEGKHQIAYIWDPDATWLFLRKISLGILFTWFLTVIVLGAVIVASNAVAAR